MIYHSPSPIIICGSSFCEENKKECSLALFAQIKTKNQKFKQFFVDNRFFFNVVRITTEGDSI